MKNRWTVQTEKGDHNAYAVWGAIEKAAGKKSTAIVLNTNSRAAVIILASGMFYLKGPGMARPVLFRIENCTRARIKSCMLIKAVEAADIVRSRENSILREMRKLLELDMVEKTENSIPAAVLQTVAS
ncbi:MAG: hypothetical protein K8S62_14370 [Candidatus Sabulitectum sp.]|nr:hypothetical protein [Candidatus Sabulitectum sp.]